MKVIPLTKGLEAIVDDEDYAWLNAFKWWTVKSNGGYYARRSVAKKPINMHRIVINAPDGMIVDHINRNTLDNRRCNLRLANRYQSASNRGSFERANKKSQYKGVSYWNERRKWGAYIGHNNKQIFLGLFLTEVEAAMAYNKAALELFGEFAGVNVIVLP